jgi:hypothetical protein
LGRWVDQLFWRRDPESNRTNRICNPGHNRFAIAPSGPVPKTPLSNSDKKGKQSFPFEFGAGNEIRTRDLNLGKVALYQLSYSRIFYRLPLRLLLHFGKP